MQRNFSVDDILGTFWKLDTQGEGKGPVQVSIPEEEEDEDTYIPVVESLKTIEVDRGMNRSASEYAFQEFLKVNETSGGFARAKSRFVASEEIRDKEEEDDDDDEDDTDPASPASPASPESPEISENKTQLAKQESDDFNEASNQGAIMPPAPPVQPKLEVRTMSGIVDQVEVSGALNPLFSGIRDEVEIAATATNSPQEYEFFLKKKLDLACAAVALSRSGSGGANSGPLAPQSSVTPGAFGAMSVGNPIGIPALPPKPEYGAMVPPTRSRAVTSGSDVSDDDESEQGHNVAPGDIKRVKRMLSNRESARRSRRRKQAHLSELEAQVAQLRLENSTILKRVTEISLKFQEAAIENRVLKADVATLQAKLKMAESLVSGATNGQAGPMDLSHSGPRYMSYSTGDNGPQYVQPAPVVQQKEQQQGFTGGKMGRTPSMQRVASLEHLQKRIRGGAACNNPAWSGSFEDGHSMLEQHED
ncbi:hypothetical protein M758_7G110700 [Ceratodon purpureus]|uniref:BZIP domain-containing protein n=1 Tax=Ceratodon purpureus TaxID=3225 RepID=A0A8T0HCG7_CERPU|nr:hypothetical protein KC19_7G165700 [Ceratodon purpureus]KAG0611050.1 hypothetical protein M758_7G110700 [Ceratodon purpureus]